MSSILPGDGSILIVDDKIDEALPLVELLSKAGCAVTYYSGGDDDRLPSTPAQKIRLAFFDIQLTLANSPHDNAQIILRLLDKLVPPGNGPYVLVIWSSKEDEHATELEAQVTSDQNAKKPVAIIRLEKSTYLRTVVDTTDRDIMVADIVEALGTRFDDGDLLAIRTAVVDRFPNPTATEVNANALESISAELYTQLVQKCSGFLFFVFWENLIYRAASSTAELFASVEQSDEFWSENVKYAIYKMAKAQLEQQLKKVKPQDVVSYAVKTLNSTLLDLVAQSVTTKDITAIVTSLDSKIDFRHRIGNDVYRLHWDAKVDKYQVFINDNRIGGQAWHSPNKIRNAGRNDPEKLLIDQVVAEHCKTVPAINSNLLFEKDVSDTVVPGNLYVRNRIHWARRRKLLENYFKDSGTLLGATNGVKNTPNSDLNNIFFVELEITPNCDYAQDKWEKSRLLPGIMVPKDLTTEKQKDSESFYQLTPELLYRGKSYQVILDFKLLKSEDFSFFEGRTPILRFRNELMADVISRLAGHASRTGITFVS